MCISNAQRSARTLKLLMFEMDNFDYLVTMASIKVPEVKVL